MTTNHSRGRERHDRGTLLAGLITLTALAAAVLLAISLAPASAETPAERCKRETTAYNNAWKNSWAASHPGEKPSDAPRPPVPYKCGSNNDGPPPTVQPTTTTPEAPTGTTAPESTVPSDSSGPDLNNPTDRRDIQHPGVGQPTIGSGSDTSRTQPQTTSVPVSPKRKQPSTTVGQQSQTKRDPSASADPLSNVNFRNGPKSPGDGLRHNADDPHGKWYGGCEEGYHRNNGGLGNCYPDYDYNVIDVQAMGRQRGAALVSCSYGVNPCTIGKSVTLTSTKSWEVGGELGGEVGNDVGAKASAQISAKYGQSMSQEVQYSSSMGLDTSKLKPGQRMVGYSMYNKYLVTVQKYHTESKTVESTKQYIVLIPIDGLDADVEGV
ncbi:hypothetical protein [Gordonia malaquae]|uniref:hypothetical protein n=1 Tax=Gordonia malaquae TaxID=410332 RepID=UPI00301647A1